MGLFSLFHSKKDKPPKVNFSGSYPSTAAELRAARDFAAEYHSGPGGRKLHAGARPSQQFMVMDKYGIPHIMKVGERGTVSVDDEAREKIEEFGRNEPRMKEERRRARKEEERAREYLIMQAQMGEGDGEEAGRYGGMGEGEFGGGPGGSGGSGMFGQGPPGQPSGGIGGSKMPFGGGMGDGGFGGFGGGPGGDGGSAMFGQGPPVLASGGMGGSQMPFGGAPHPSQHASQFPQQQQQQEIPPFGLAGPGGFAGRGGFGFGASNHHGPDQPFMPFQAPSQHHSLHGGVQEHGGFVDPLMATALPIGARGQRKYVPGQSQLDPRQFGPLNDPDANFKHLKALEELRKQNDRRSGGGGGTRRR
ncbi:hypothetical protein N0V83_007655 [Neocucurbitaria cava]|uniref:Uncharacterized protein n=1 Tax=Neocucurbitaria cava TaxID=798079 RepID=A0A9W8Y425_9PLEO|nr:hypothetical protein N0V83_007655 [Neocucurbitaria cava]